VILVVAQALALWWFAPVPRRRAAATLLAALAVAAIPAAAYFGWSWIDLGTPSTSSQQRAFALHEFAGRLFGPLYRSAAAVDEVTSSPWIFALAPAAVGLALTARRWLAAYGALTLGGYLAFLTFVAPAFHDTPRYLLPVVPLVAAGVSCALARTRGSALRWPAAAAAVLAIGASSGVAARDRVELLRSFGITKEEVFERDAVARLNALARPGDAVLAYEVQLRYFLRGDVRVLATDGVTDGKVRPYQDSRDLTAFLMRYRPRWWIADRNTLTRPYMRGSVLARALRAHTGGARPATPTIDGIAFTVVARRGRPLARGFGGWLVLFRLGYPPRQPG
jgi:hypothetical protein